MEVKSSTTSDNDASDEPVAVPQIPQFMNTFAAQGNVIPSLGVMNRPPMPMMMQPGFRGMYVVA